MIDLVLVVALRAAARVDYKTVVVFSSHFVTFFPLQKNFTERHPSIDTTHADTRRHAERERACAWTLYVNGIGKWRQKITIVIFFSFVFLPQILPLSLWRFRSPPPLLRLFDDVFARAGTAHDGGESRERVSGDVRVEEHEN